MKRHNMSTNFRFVVFTDEHDRQLGSVRQEYTFDGTNYIWTAPAILVQSREMTIEQFEEITESVRNLAKEWNVDTGKIKD